MVYVLVEAVKEAPRLSDCKLNGIVIVEAVKEAPMLSDCKLNGICHR